MARFTIEVPCGNLARGETKQATIFYAVLLSWSLCGQALIEPTFSSRDLLKNSRVFVCRLKHIEKVLSSVEGASLQRMTISAEKMTNYQLATTTTTNHSNGCAIPFGRMFPTDGGTGILQSSRLWCYTTILMYTVSAYLPTFYTHCSIIPALGTGIFREPSQHTQKPVCSIGRYHCNKV